MDEEGVVQAVKILATEQVLTAVERVAYEGAMQLLSGGEQNGGNVNAWRRWWDENERRLLEERAQRYERLAAERRAR